MHHQEHSTPLLPSFTAVKVSKCSDDELSNRDVRDLLHMLRQLGEDYKWLLMKHNNLINDANTHQSYREFPTETNSLKYANQKLTDDNQEMRDLCCFLDDDRQRGRKLAREWQKFGRYTATVMKREVTSYQTKLNDLERQQDNLIRENNELKQLCILLDDELSGMMVDRDEGDGSSNTTVASEQRIDDVALNTGTVPYMLQNSGCRNVDRFGQDIEQPDANARKALSSPSQASMEPHYLQRQTPTPIYENATAVNHAQNHQRSFENHRPYLRQDNDSSNAMNSSHRPPDRGWCASGPERGASSAAALVNAVRVLDVHDRYTGSSDNLGNKEKAIVREMCNVVWRKLGNAKNTSSTPPDK